MTEKQIMHAIMLEAPKRGCRLMRNNVGMLRDINGTRVAYGLGVGTSDLIGWKFLPSALEKELNDEEQKYFNVAIFTAIEVKGPHGRVSPRQQQFINIVNKSGGLAGVCRSVEDFIKLVS